MGATMMLMLVFAVVSPCLSFTLVTLKATNLICASSSFGHDGLGQGLIFATMLGMSAYEASHVPLSTEPAPEPDPMPLEQDQDTEQDHACYPIDLEDCETCEYNEEHSDYYGEPIWLCSS